MGGGGGGMKFGMSRRIKPKRKYVSISMKKTGRNLDGPPKCKKGAALFRSN